MRNEIHHAQRKRQNSYKTKKQNGCNVQIKADKYKIYPRFNWLYLRICLIIRKVFFKYKSKRFNIPISLCLYFVCFLIVIIYILLCSNVLAWRDFIGKMMNYVFLCINMAELKILSYNVQGLGDISKRTDVFDFLKNTNFDIYCLQETHFTDREEKLILNLWNGECLFNNYRSNARGVAILFGKNMEYKVHKKITDNEGNFLVVDITAQSKRFTLINIYGPNTDSPTFYQKKKGATALGTW